MSAQGMVRRVPLDLSPHRCLVRTTSATLALEVYRSKLRAEGVAAAADVEGMAETAGCLVLTAGLHAACRRPVGAPLDSASVRVEQRIAVT
jgi:hypothetical protein